MLIVGYVLCFWLLLDTFFTTVLMITFRKCFAQFLYAQLQPILATSTLDTTTKFFTMTIWTSRNLRLRVYSWLEIMQEYCFKTSSNICFGYLLESPQWGDSNKYPKPMFSEEIRIKQGLSYISFCPLRILYNSKFILMAKSFGTNVVAVTRFHCLR